MKRLCSLCLCVVVSLCFMLFFTTTADAANYEFFTYEVSDGEVTITECYPGVFGDLVIPTTIEGNPVTAIGDRAFYNCTYLTSVTIGDGVTTIGDSAFSACTALREITLPETLQHIGNNAFSNCIVLTGVDIPEGLTSIGNSAFDNCKKITAVTIPDSVISLGDSAFESCVGLESVTIGSGLTGIADNTFFGCENLTSVVFGSGITAIGQYAFTSCESLTDIVIPEGVTTIGSGAFRYCTGLTNITIPASVTGEVENAFTTCTNLVGIWVDPDNANYSSDAYGVLFNKDKTKLLIVPQKLAGSYVLPDGITVIDGTAFFQCTELTSITIPDSVTYIDMNAFYQCTGLTNITFGSGVETIGSSSFVGCTSLTTLHIPNNVKTIGHGAFSSCTSLESIYLGNGLTSIVDSAFYNCNNVKNVYYSGTQEQWDSIQIGDYNTGIENATIYFNGHVHVYTNYISNNDATYLADGTKTAKCDLCDATHTIIDEGSRLIPEVGMIHQHPTSVTTDSGETVTFSVTALGEVSSYKWQYRKLHTWFDTALTGCSTDTLTVAATGRRNNYSYRCVITFADGTVLISDEAKLTVKTYMNITDHPSDQTVVLGYKGQFTAAAEGEGIQYQWQYCRPGSDKWTDTTMDGATKATVFIESTTARDGYMYRCRITDATGNEQFTEAATLRVLSFTSQPAAEVFAPVGGVATFTVTTNVSEGVRYQWQYRRSATGSWTNTAMTGYNTDTLTVDATLARNGYEYRCVITGSKNSKIESTSAVLRVGDPVASTTQPADSNP